MPFLLHFLGALCALGGRGSFQTSGTPLYRMLFATGWGRTDKSLPALVFPLGREVPCRHLTKTAMPSRER